MKKVIKTVVFGASVLALASVANATEYNVNIYGASAQNEFWNDAADDFLAAATTANGLGCTTVQQDRTTSKDGISRGTNCAGLPDPADVIYIRYSARASADGPRSVYGIDPDNVDSCDTEGFTDSYRKMADETTVDWDPTTVGGSNKCVDVTLGASDVASSSFTQVSEGNEEGFLQNGPVTRFDMNANLIPGEAQGLIPHRPVVVPFAFFGNGPAMGWDTTDPANPVAGAGAITNVSRVQAANLMAGNVYNWSQFGPDFPNKKVVVCLRHAGSGTHATLDKAVMRGDFSIAEKEAWPGTFTPNTPYLFFHISSSDLIKCVDQNGNSPSTGGFTTDVTTHMAIGYADADKNAPDAITGAIKYPDAVTLNYNGYSPAKQNITNGNYTFWSQQWIYENPADANYNTLQPIHQKMVDFASDPANLPATKANYWAAANELNVVKPFDTSLPSVQ